MRALAIVATIAALATPAAAQQPQGATVALRITEAAAVAALAYEYADNRFTRLSGAADALENAAPAALHYNRWGDPATWVHHAAWTAGAAGVGAAAGALTGAGWRRGARDFATLALAFYIVRELHSAVGAHQPCYGAWRDRCARQPYQHGVSVGWAWDGLGDILGPLSINILLRR